jgi:ribose 5-phosphate isomerase A
VADDQERKRAWAAAGELAAARVENGMRVGIGTGRAASAGIRALGRRVAEEGLDITAVPTSRDSEHLARELGIPLGRLKGPLDIAFDGADAVDPTGLIVKGNGGALVRERIVARASGTWLVLVDGPKLVRSLDEWGRLPVAVVPFAAGRVSEELEDLSPVRRPGRSDDDLVLIDLHVPADRDWHEWAERASAEPGVVDHGLFSSPLENVIVGQPDGEARRAADPGVLPVP